MKKILKIFPLNSLDFSQANTVHTNRIHKLYTFVFYFPLHVSAILTIITWNTGKEGKVLQKRYSI